MSEDQRLFQFTNDAVNLLLNLAAPSNEGTVLLLGSIEGFPEVADNFKIRRATDPNELTTFHPANFDGAVVIPRFDADVEDPVSPLEGRWKLPTPCNMQAYLIAHAWSQVRPGGRIVALVGRDLLAVDRGNRADLRKALREHGLSVIAEVPNKAFRNSGVNTPTYIAVLLRKDEASQSITLVDLSEEERLPPASAFNSWCQGQSHDNIKAEQVIVTQTDIEHSNRIDPDFYNNRSIRTIDTKTDVEEYLLDSIADINTGIDLDATKRLAARSEKGTIPYLLVGNLNQDGTIRDVNYWVREADVRQHLGKLAMPGDILVSATGTIGKVALFPESTIGFLYNTSLRRIRVKPGNNVTPQAIAAFLRSPEGQAELLRHETGGVIPHLSNKNLKRVRVRLPKESHLEPKKHAAESTQSTSTPNEGTPRGQVDLTSIAAATTHEPSHSGDIFAQPPEQAEPAERLPTPIEQSQQLRVLVSAIRDDMSFVAKFQEQIKLLQEEEPFFLDVVDASRPDQELLGELKNTDIFIPFVCKEYIHDERLKKLFKQACELMPSEQLDVAPIVVRDFHWKIGAFAGLRELGHGHVVRTPNNDPVWTIVAQELHGRLNAIANKRRATDHRPTFFEAAADPNDPLDAVIEAETPVGVTDTPAIAESASVALPPPFDTRPTESAAPPDGAFMAPSSTITRTASSSRPCWFVGATWGGGNDQTSRFVEQGIWENEYEDRYLDEVKSIQPGDRIAIKATHTRKKNVPFEHRGHWVSVMAIKAIGVVKENVGDGRNLKVEWTRLDSPRDWYLYTFIGRVWRVPPGEWMSDALIAFTFEQQEQDIARFRNAPYWKQRFGDGPAEDLRFQWTKFYQAIADKLLDFKDDRSKLVAGIHAIVSRVDGSSYLHDQFKDGTTGPLKDICPFTAMGIFNRGLNVTNRENIARELAQFLGVAEKVPTSFDGVPVLNNMKSWFFGTESIRQPDDIDALWTVFVEAIRFVDSDDIGARPGFLAAYDDAARRREVGWNLTIGLYWVRPWEFPTLDSKSQIFIPKKLGVKIGTNNPKGYCTGSDYLAAREELAACFRDAACPVHSFPELSLAAWQFDTDQALPSTSDKVIVDAGGDNNLGGNPQRTTTTAPPLNGRQVGAETAEISPQEEKTQTTAPSKNSGIELWLSIQGGQAKLVQDGKEVWLRDGLLPKFAEFEYNTGGRKTLLKDVVPRLHRSNEDDIKVFGDFLGKTLFNETLPKELGEAMAWLPGGAQLRLVLDLDGDAATIPWEYVRCNQYFLIEQRVSIIRHVDANVVARPLTLNPMPRKLLFAWANPVGTDSFVGEQHIPKVEQSLDLLSMTVRSVGECSPRLLQNALHPSYEFEVFHYLGHGEVQPGTDPVLVLHSDPDGTGPRHPINANDLTTWLGNFDRKLVFLGACHGGTVPPENPFSSFAREIVRRTGTPVVAMQIAVPRPFATEFSCQFYRELQKTGSIEKAVYLARQVSHNGRHAFGIPVLYADVKQNPRSVDLPDAPKLHWSFAVTNAPPIALNTGATAQFSTSSIDESQSASAQVTVGFSSSNTTQGLPLTLPPPVITPGEVDVVDNRDLKINWEDVEARTAALCTRYAFPPSLIYRVVGELAAGRHILLIGPVGTGKTSLAREICRMIDVQPLEGTASADWTVFDIVGGFFPHHTVDEDTKNSTVALAFRNGLFTDAVLRNWVDVSKKDGSRRWCRNMDLHWLILDEMNRADMDRAMGAVFTALESRRLRVPCASTAGAPSTTEIPIPMDFRVIATMNAVDRHYLFRLSDALKRRFAFIEVPVTSDFVHERNAIVSQCSEHPGRNPDNEPTLTLLRFVYLVRLFFPLGTAQLLAAHKFLAATSASPISSGERITQAIVGSVLPSLEDSPAELLGLLETWAIGTADSLTSMLCDLDARDKKSGLIGGLRMTTAEFLEVVKFALPDAEVGESDGPAADHILELARQLNRGALEPLVELGHRLREMKRMSESGRV